MAQATLLARHKVEDFGAWRAVYDSVEPLRKEHGCTDAEVMVDPADGHDVYVVHRFPTLEQARRRIQPRPPRGHGPSRGPGSPAHRDSGGGLI